MTGSIESLERIVGSGNVSDDEVDLWAYSKDASPGVFKVPAVVAVPRSTEEIASIMRLANRSKFSVVPRGGGTSQGWAAISPEGDGVILDLTKMNKIIDISEEDMTLTAQAGIAWCKAYHELEKKDLRMYPFFFTSSAFSATLGGSISSGSQASQGALRGGTIAEGVISLEVVLPDGSTIRTHSDALPGAGRFARTCNGGNLGDIFLGSMGIYGIITEATLRVENFPRIRKYSTWLFKNWDDALNFGYRIIRKVVPSTMNVPAGSDIKWRYGIEGVAVFRIPIEGNDEIMVNRQKEIIDETAKENGGVEIEGQEKETELWWNMAGQRMLLYPEEARKAARMHAGGCFRIPWKKAPQVIQFCETFTKKWKLDEDPNFTECGGHFYFSDMAPQVTFAGGPGFDSSIPEAREKAQLVWDDYIRGVLDELKGVPYWTGYHWAKFLSKRLMPQYYRFMVTIKKALDPNNILNPGLLVTGY